MTKYYDIINLDGEFSPFFVAPNYIGMLLEIKKITFPGGERHIQILNNRPYKDGLIITQRVNSTEDFFEILLANDAARRMGYKHIELIIPYFPAARQDRVCNVGEPLTVKVFADLINACGFEKVSILCPHSEVTPALLNNVKVLDIEVDLIKQIVKENSDGHVFNIVSPDAGAAKRVGKIAQELANSDTWHRYDLITCGKVRDVKDGSLKAFTVQEDDLNGAPTIIIDDVNCKAGTFIGLGKKLKERNCGRLLLFTTHSDCVEGIQNASGFFDHVYTTNSKKNWEDLANLDNFTCFL
jgi:ribose-phosphate pyrophosphokinase